MEGNIKAQKMNPLLIRYDKFFKNILLKLSFCFFFIFVKEKYLNLLYLTTIIKKKIDNF